jgi:hypothetical protein
MKLVTPVGWYVIFWMTGAAIFLVAVRVCWVNPLLAVMREMLVELKRWP